MAKAIDKIKKIASEEKSGWLKQAEYRQENKAWRRRSFQIAVRILREIRKQKENNGLTQKKLAQEMGVSPQYINKIVKGQENLTLETISKIEDVLGIRLIEVPEMEAVISVKASDEKENLAVRRNEAKEIGSKTTSIKDEDWHDFNPENKPDGTYG